MRQILQMHDYMIYGKTRFYFRSPGTDTALDREEVLDALKELHIGEWEKYYDPMRFGYCVMDGTQWSVTFEYSNGKDALEISGNNDYPYNFNEFAEIFDAEIIED